MSRIILTDPHGCFKTLMALIAQLPKGVPLTFAGDLIDRGPDSRKIIEYVRDNGHDCVLGNHEVMMLQELKFRIEDGQEHVFVDRYNGIWEMNGGDSCLESFRYDSTEELESGEILKIRPYDIAALKAAAEWLKTLPYHILYENEVDAKGNKLLVTHTTAADVWDRLSPENPEFQDSVTWSRHPLPPRIDGIYNVYGHTPQQHKATIKEHFACIDGGGYYKRANYGKLFALQFPEMITYTQENIE